MPSTPLRQNVLASARHLVVKLGTQLLTGADGRLDVKYLSEVAEQIAALRRRKLDVTLVCSGAVGAGMAELKLTKRPRDVSQLQAVAAIGQPRLMDHLARAFSKFGIEPAQLLLTRSDFDDRVRFLNIRNCVTQLHKYNCIPIINENDTVAVDEIRLGDNDLLAALMCNALRADALVILTVVDGVLDEKGDRIDLVRDVGRAFQMAQRKTSALGTGGFQTKLEAVRLVTEAGELAVIANGRARDVLTRLLDGQPGLGTVFVPAGRKLDSRQRWIGLTKRPAGTVTVDAGAAVALTQRGKSLLATGIVDVTGKFERGEILIVRAKAGAEIARGITNYSAPDLRLIMGKRSNQLEKILGRKAFDEVIHRDNLVVPAS